MNLQPINPYQIIKSLKAENDALKAENEQLKKEVAEYALVSASSDGQVAE